MPPFRLIGLGEEGLCNFCLDEVTVSGPSQQSCTGGGNDEKYFGSSAASHPCSPDDKAG